MEGLDAVIKRAKMYIDAGADMIFPEGLESNKIAIKINLILYKQKAPEEFQ